MEPSTIAPSAQNNHWQTVWNKRQGISPEIDMNDVPALFLEMKRINGWDFGGGNAVPFEEFQREYQYTKNNLRIGSGDSVFECCCGCGANLYLFAADGFVVGGLDYAEQMIAIMQDIFSRSGFLLRESICDEAVKLPAETKYDAVMSAGSTQYFPNEEYAERVIGQMVEKSKKSVGILRILDKEKQSSFLAYRRKNDPNYDERYRNLPKLYLSRSFFESFAQKHGLGLKFDSVHLKNFWNDAFVFDCFLYKQAQIR